jgi:hypothetical protein
MEKKNKKPGILTKADLKWINNLTDKQKEKLAENIEKRHLSEFKNNLSFWISIYDLIEAVKTQEGNKSQIQFVTGNKQILDLYKLIKKSKLKVRLVDDYLQEEKK